MPKRHAPKPQPKAQVHTCMGMLDEDSFLLDKGPLRRADGAAAYNGYFWPLAGDWYWANRELGDRYSSRWNFKIIALAGGTWLSDGAVSKAEQYPTRAAALRVAAARLLRTIRYARKWSGIDRVSPEAYPILVAWVFGKVGQSGPRISVPKPHPFHRHRRRGRTFLYSRRSNFDGRALHHSSDRPVRDVRHGSDLSG